MNTIQKWSSQNSSGNWVKNSQKNQVLFTGIQESSRLKSRESTEVIDFSYIPTNNTPHVKWEKSLLFAEVNRTIQC